MVVQHLMDGDAGIGQRGSMETVLRVLRRVTGMRIILVAEVTDSSWTACFVLDDAGFGIHPGDQLTLSDTYWSTVRGAVAPLVITHASEDARFSEHPGVRKLGVESYVAVPLVRHDGSIFGTLCALDPRPATIDSEVLETFTLLADLVAYQMEEEEERQRREIAEEERRTFVETVAHDLKSPLQVVKSQAQMIQRRLHQNRPLSEEMLGSRLEQIEAAVNRSTELINEMLDASRLRSGQQLELHLESVDLATLVHESVDRERIASSAHEFHIDASETPLIAHIDRSRIARVLGNLLGNATRYSDGGPVRVSIEQETDDAGRWAVISVSDEGIGIPKSDLPHIFERYRRGRNVGQRAVGMGIGLAGSCQIVEQHGGSISVESVEGEGSTFTMRLPLA